MRKRPLCFLALVLAAVLLFLDKGGLSGKGKPPDHPVIQELIEKGEPVEVFGEADRWETYETYNSAIFWRTNSITWCKSKNKGKKKVENRRAGARPGCINAA